MAAIRAFSFISLILPQTCPVYAAFYFNKSVEFIDVDTSQPITPNEITVQFNSVCQSPETECTVGKGQNYSFGLSSTHITPDNATTGSDIPPILIQDNWLNSDLKEVTYKEKSLVIPRQGQSWAEQINFNQSAYWQTATLRLDIHKQLVDKNRGCLYLIGLDSEGTKFWDTLEICFREKDNRKIRISNLKPVPLDASHNSENNAYLLPFCVYVSDGSEYLLQASGLHIDNENEFNLVNGNNNRLQYKLGFSPDISGNNWLPLKPGDAETGTGNSHIDTLCGGQTNARFRIHLNDDVDSAPSGVYSDIVTVTVTPK